MRSHSSHLTDREHQIEWMPKKTSWKMPEEKEHLTCRGARIKITLDFSTETTQAKRMEWNIYTVERKQYTHQPGMLYPAKLSFKRKGETKTSSDKQKLREFVSNIPALQKKCFKKVLQKEEKWYRLEIQSYIKKGRTLENE